MSETMGGAWMHPVCSKCHESTGEIWMPCPSCGYQHPLTEAGKLYQKQKMHETGYNIEFKVKCPRCNTVTIKEKNKCWTFCPKCNAALDIMNKI